MAMGRVEGAAHKASGDDSVPGGARVSVGEFRAFVKQTGYITDCERQDGAWVYAARKQWVRKPDACWDNPYRPQEEDDPVVLVSWYDAVMFANWKSAREGFAEAYNVSGSQDRRVVEWDRGADGYRLPTADEWEQSAEAGGEREGLPGPSRALQKLGKMVPVLPPQLACEGITNGHGLEWCWDPRAGNPAVEVLGSISQGCRRIVVDAGKERCGPDCHGACHPLTAVGTLSFRLVRSGAAANVRAKVRSRPTGAPHR